jgi:hypothetical protein
MQTTKYLQCVSTIKVLLHCLAMSSDILLSIPDTRCMPSPLRFPLLRLLSPRLTSPTRRLPRRFLHQSGRLHHSIKMRAPGQISFPDISPPSQHQQRCTIPIDGSNFDKEAFTLRIPVLAASVPIARLGQLKKELAR